MQKTVRAIPEGYSVVTQSLVVKQADKLLDFLKDAFDARESGVFKMPDGKIAHAEAIIGDTRVMLGEETPDALAMPGRAYVYVRDVDSSYRKALDVGAVSIREPKDQFYGDRTATVKDPTGNVWTLATHKEDLSQEEQMKRMMAQPST